MPNGFTRTWKNLTVLVAVVAVTFAALIPLASAFDGNHAGHGAPVKVSKHLHKNEAGPGLDVEHLHEIKGCSTACQIIGKEMPMVHKISVTQLDHWIATTVHPDALGQTPPYRPPISFV